MTLEEAVEICKQSFLSGWDLVEYAQSFVNKNMAYSYDNSFDMPTKAFKRGRGYCWQRAKSLQKILNDLGFECHCVYAAKNQMPETQFEGIIVKAHISGHVWCRVTIGEIIKDVCSGNLNNKPGIVHFTPLSTIRKWNCFVSFWAYWISATINHQRLKEIRRHSQN